MTLSSFKLAPRWAAALATVACGCRDVAPAGQAGLADTGSPASACPSAWFEAPAVDRSIAVPEGNKRVVLHASAQGTQDYVCAAAPDDGGASYAWSLRGPDATLSDCRAAAIGRHFPSAAGPPEWQLSDGSYVVGHKAATFAVDGAAIPWLLLSLDGHGGEGRLGDARYVQRVQTVGGGLPEALCDASHAGSVQKVAYQAQYFFFGP